MSTEYTATRTAVRTAAILTLFAGLFTAAMAMTYRMTKPDIEAAVAEVKRKLIAEVLPPASYNNILLDDALKLPPTEALGLDEGGLVYRARKDGQPIALIVEARANNGYGGTIALIVAVRNDGSISGVRVTDHKETPGLGDYIDRNKDRNKSAPWIDQFANGSFARTPREAWQVKKDGGSFDFRAGATISARAVTTAVASTLEWTNTHRDALFAADTGSAFGPGNAGGTTR